MFSAANDHAADRADVFKVPPPRHCDVTIIDELIVRRIHIHPARCRDIHLNPGMRGISSNELRCAGRREGFEITADVTRGQPDCTQAADLKVREILTHAAPGLEYLLERR